MSGKFVALLLVLSCVQGFNAHVAQYDETPFAIDDIVKLLNELVAKIRAAIDNFQQLLKDFEKRIKDAIAKIDIPGLITEFQKKIQDIIDKAGVTASTAAECIADEGKAVEQLVSSTTKGVNDCLKTSDPLKNQIISQIADITSESVSLIASITGSISKCFISHPLNPIKLLSCLQDLVEPTTQQVNDFLGKINKDIEDDQKLIGESIDKLGTCVSNIAADVDKQKDAIIDKFQKCVDALIS